MVTAELLDRKYAWLLEEAATYRPFEVLKLDEGVQLIPKDADAFALWAPIAGMTRTQQKTKDDKMSSSFILRMVIPYSAAMRMEENFNSGVLYLSEYVNKALGAAYQYANEFESLTFKRPGHFVEYFREFENNAGYELRLYGVFKKTDG